MNLAFLLSLQAAASPAPLPATRIAAADFDLAKYIRPAPPRDIHSLFVCDRSTGSDIVVCARRAGPAYPIEEMARIFEPRPLRAEAGIGRGTTAGVHVEQAQFGADTPSAHSGLTSNRIMVGIKQSF
jgi:hypothetical protein